jgi:hypothetical protein
MKAHTNSNKSPEGKQCPLGLSILAWMAFALWVVIFALGTVKFGGAQ